MTKVIMHGCNGKMGQMITGIIAEDKDIERIINRLAKAATISDIRMTMNIEDEIYSELENLDTKILSQKKALAQKDKQLTHQEEQLTQQKELLRNTIKMLLETGKTPSEIDKKLYFDLPQANYNLLVQLPLA